MSLLQHKIVIGTNNTHLFEDPVLGSNGTAICTRINALIEELQTQLQNIEVSSYKSLIGDGLNSSYIINHGLDGDVMVQLINVHTGDYVLADINIIDNNNLEIVLGSVIDIDSLKVLVLKV